MAQDKMDKSFDLHLRAEFVTEVAEVEEAAAITETNSHPSSLRETRLKWPLLQSRGETTRYWTRAASGRSQGIRLQGSEGQQDLLTPGCNTQG